MGRTVIKAERAGDVYMIYSTVVDGFIAIGTREELAAEERIDDREFARADERGSSSVFKRGLWESKTLMIAAVETRSDSQYYLLDRKDFGEYARLMLAERDAEAEALLTAVKDEENE
jgi:hypothetical protein